MYIGSGLNTVSSLYGQQKGNQMKSPASGEKTFYTAETPKVYQIFTTDRKKRELGLHIILRLRESQQVTQSEELRIMKKKCGK